MLRSDLDVLAARNLSALCLNMNFACSGPIRRIWSFVDGGP